MVTFLIVSAEAHEALCRKPNSRHTVYDCALCRRHAERLSALYGPVSKL